MADYSNDVEKALPPRKGKSKRKVDPGGRGIHLRRGEDPDWKTWGDVLLFQTKDGERSVTPRGQMDEDRWNALVDRAKEDPDFAAQYADGEVVQTGPKSSLGGDGRVERDDAARVTPGEPTIGKQPPPTKLEPLTPFDASQPRTKREEAVAAAKAMPQGPAREYTMQALAKAGALPEAKVSVPAEDPETRKSEPAPQAAAELKPAPPQAESTYVDEASAGAFPDSGGGGNSPLGMMHDLVMRAAPQPQAQQLPTMDLTEPQQLPEMDLTAPAPPQQLPTMDLTQDGYLSPPPPVGGAGPNGPPNPVGPPSQLTAGQALPMQQNMSAGKALVDTAANTERAMQQGLIPRPGGGKLGGPGEQGSPRGASLSVAGGGGFRKPELQYPEVDTSAVDALRSEANKLNETTDGLLRDEASRQVQLKADLTAQQAEVDKLNAAQSEGFERNYQEMERYQSAAQQTLAEMQARSAQAIDTNRFFRNMDIAKKVSTILAGALYGFLGKGLEWQSHLDGLVEQDIRSQESDRDAAMKGLDAKARGFFDARDFAMKMGARKDEAFAIQKAAHYKAMDMFLANAEREAKSAEVRQRAAEMRFDIGQKIAEAQQRGADMVQRRVDKMNDDAKWTAAQEATDRRFRMQLALKQQATAAKGKSGKLPPKMADRLFAIEDARKAIAQMKRYLSKGVLQTLGDESVKHGPEMLQNAQESLGLTTAPSRRVALASLARRVIAGVEGRQNALTMADDAALKEFGLDVGLASTKTDAILNGWLEKATHSRESLRKTAAESGYGDIGPDDYKSGGGDPAFEASDSEGAGDQGPDDEDSE